MKKAWIVTLLAVSPFFSACDEVDSALQSLNLSDAEITEGLKAALNVGTNTSVVTASAQDGYLKNELIKILLPPEVLKLKQEVETREVNLGIAKVKFSDILATYIAVNPNIENDLFEELSIAMNRGAESAADKALPIFSDAITNLSITDALGILQGGETAATNYFQTNTQSALFTAFQPDVKTALDQTKANVIYQSAVGFLNYEYSLGLASVKVSDFINVELPETLDGYATEKAIDGMFHLVSGEEKKIRDNPTAWASDIIAKVFGSREAQGG